MPPGLGPGPVAAEGRTSEEVDSTKNHEHNSTNVASHTRGMGTTASKDEKLPPITYDKDGKQLGRLSMRRLRLPATGAAGRAGGARLRMHVQSLVSRKEERSG